jgi:hypothetical protein
VGSPAWALSDATLIAIATGHLLLKTTAPPDAPQTAQELAVARALLQYG